MDMQATLPTDEKDLLILLDGCSEDLWDAHLSGDRSTMLLVLNRLGQILHALKGDADG